MKTFFDKAVKKAVLPFIFCFLIALDIMFLAGSLHAQTVKKDRLNSPASVRLAKLKVPSKHRKPKFSLGHTTLLVYYDPTSPMVKVRPQNVEKTPVRSMDDRKKNQSEILVGVATYFYLVLLMLVLFMGDMDFFATSLAGKLTRIFALVSTFAFSLLVVSVFG